MRFDFEGIGPRIVKDLTAVLFEALNNRRYMGEPERGNTLAF
jgi:hypothetical protein